MPGPGGANLLPVGGSVENGQHHSYGRKLFVDKDWPYESSSRESVPYPIHMYLFSPYTTVIQRDVGNSVVTKITCLSMDESNTGAGLRRQPRQFYLNLNQSPDQE